MTFKVFDHGRDNRVEIAEGIPDQQNGSIILRGDGNRVSIGAYASSQNLQIDVGTRCTVEIGPVGVLGRLLIFGQTDATISIGSQCSFNGEVHLMCHEPGTLRVGAGCLFADGVEALTSDMHSLIDAQSGARLNPGGDIIIEDRVWVGRRVMILKGARIGTGSVIGACAVVTRAIPPMCSAAGMPARILRRGVTWRPDLI